LAVCGQMLARSDMKVSPRRLHGLESMHILSRFTLIFMVIP